MVADDKLVKHYASYEQYLRKAKRDFDAKMAADVEQDCSLLDFDIIKTLGSGSFGLVVMCRDKRDKCLCALKMMEKSNIVKTKQLVHTAAEVKLMRALYFPFIVEMRGFFMNNTYVGLLMSFAHGGDMFIHLRTMKKFEESLCKFYAAQVILAFDYLHYLGVIYRDLKPENILLNLDGYLKITDLGFCKKIDDSRTYTICGTPEYLAPELILSQGYNKSVDWWSLGILMYEMASGYAPFYSKEPMRLYEKIVSGRYSCPAHFSKPLKELLSNILVIDRTKRYGVLKNGSKDIKGHEWFKEINFDDIWNKKVVSSYVPSVDSETDTKFFEIPKKNFEMKALSENVFEKEFSQFPS